MGEEAWLTDKIWHHYCTVREEDEERESFLVGTAMDDARKRRLADALSGQLGEVEEAWLTDEIWHHWRCQHRDVIQSLQCSRCSAEPLSHDARFFGTDADGDPIFMNCFVLPRDLNPDGIVSHMTCLFERSLRRFPRNPDAPGTRTWTWIIDLFGFSYIRHSDPRTSIGLLKMLQTGYPGRLKHMLLIDAPSTFWVLWKAVQPFIDPVTAAKIEFLSWDEALARYSALFGEAIAGRLRAEGEENRDDARVESKVWTTFDGPGLGSERLSEPAVK